MGSDRRALSIQCSDNGVIKFTLSYLDGVWKYEIESFRTWEIIDKQVLESLEDIKDELIKFNFATEDDV